MNFQEIKILQWCPAVDQWKVENPEDDCPLSICDLVKSCIDFDRVVSFQPHGYDKNACVVTLVQEDIIIPMSYDNFKSFFYKKTNQNP